MTWEELQIDIPRGRNSGQVATVCPRCKDDRRKKTAKCLSVNLDLGVFQCHHCQWKGSIKQRQYALPVWENKTDLLRSVIDWFLQRNIGQDIVNKMKISYADIFMPQVNAVRKCICFNYFRDGKLINIKYRDKEKNFRLYKDAELIFYNFDGIDGQEEIFITEGEADCMIMVQAGFDNTGSVPNGANAKHNNLEYLDNCYDAFRNAKKIYLMTDNDNPGNNLADELARRLGVERCFRVVMETKDVNDAVNLGEKITRDWINLRSKPYPMVGVYQASSFWDGLLNIRENGFPKGWRPRKPFGDHVEIHPGYQSIVTGIPGHGKSEFLDQMLLQLSLDHNLKGAYFSPENFPTEIHLIKMVEKLTGKRFWDLSVDEINRCKDWLQSHMHWIYPDDGFGLENILNHINKAVLRYGINWYVIDPWNKIDHQYTGPETSYISQCLDELSNFNKKKNLHGFLVVHPTKMEKDKDGNYMIPNLYSVSGSSHFFNKADLGWTVYKTGDGTTDVHIQKVKFKYWGYIGMESFLWDKVNGRYFTVDKDVSHWLSDKSPEQSLPFDVIETVDEDKCPF